MDDSNRVINGLWVEGNLSELERLSIKSFLKQGHQYHLYTYEKVGNVPPGVVLQNATDVLGQNNIFTIKGGFGAGSHGGGFSDLFRYHLLHKVGGWWADTDIVCLRPFDFSQDLVIASSKEGTHGELPNGCVLKLPRQSQYTEYLCAEAGKKDVENMGYPEMGPFLVQKMVRALGLESAVVSANTFCPISWRDVRAQIVFEESPYSLTRLIPRIKRRLLQHRYPHFAFTRVHAQSHAVHLWNEIWRSGDIDKNGSFHPTSLYERLKKKHL